MAWIVIASGRFMLNTSALPIMNEDLVCTVTSIDDVVTNYNGRFVPAGFIFNVRPTGSQTTDVQVSGSPTVSNVLFSQTLQRYLGALGTYDILKYGVWYTNHPEMFVN